MLIQFVSDIHLEINCVNPPPPPRSAPILVIAGDLGDPTKIPYTNFLHICSKIWEHVIVVAGEYEFYNRVPKYVWYHSPPDTVDMRIAACKSSVRDASNVHFLERDSVIINGIRFIGCTLWSNTERFLEEILADYTLIAGEEGNAVKPADVLAWHQRDRAWLEAQLVDTMPTVVVTHHLPTYALIAAQVAASVSIPGFASHMDDVIRPPVLAWICGHIHFAKRVIVNGVPCVLNPKGYLSEGSLRTGYNPIATLAVVAP